jgi:transposase InsO family protein
VIGRLLAAPPRTGELKAEIEQLAAQGWRHPITGLPVRFAFSTIERWYYRSVKARHDPVTALRRKVRTNAGQQISMSNAVRQALLAQYTTHKNWSIQLHRDNLVALAEAQAELQPIPSYSTIRRFFNANGLEKWRRLTARQTQGAQRAEARLVSREVRSYEAEYVGSLWHLDGHSGSLKVLTQRGWEIPLLMGVGDDRSRLSCHLQWFLGAERADIVAHCLSQAFQKRGLPRLLMTDGGSGMNAEEIIEGLNRLGIVHEKTLPYSPYVNGKIESMWTQVEGRLMAMLEGVPDLTLSFLNEATQAWVEFEYNRKVHNETGEAPVSRFLAGPDVLRPSPDSAALRLAFTKTDRRTQRRSDGTIVISGQRFEIPNRYRHLTQVEIRYAHWDLTQIHLVDERTGQVLCRLFHQDKLENSSGMRRAIEPITPALTVPPTKGVAPLLAKLLAQQTETGLPPAYLPKDDDGKDDDGDNE